MKMELQIDITDWDEEYQAEEVDLSTKEAMIEAQIKHNYHQAKVGRMYCAARERGQAEPEILPPNKSCLNAALACAWLQVLAREKTALIMPNGSIRDVRTFVLPVPEEEEEPDENPTDEGPHLAQCTSSRAIERACDYLLKRVPGYVMGRLALIAQDEARLKSAVEALHAKIDELYAELVNGKPQEA